MIALNKYQKYNRIMSEFARFSIGTIQVKTKEEGNEVEKLRWRAHSRNLGKTYHADSKQKLWMKIKSELGAERHWRRRNRWIVTYN